MCRAPTLHPGPCLVFLDPAKKGLRYPNLKSKTSLLFKLKLTVTSSHQSLVSLICCQLSLLMLICSSSILLLNNLLSSTTLLLKDHTNSTKICPSSSLALMLLKHHHQQGESRHAYVIKVPRLPTKSGTS